MALLYHKQTYTNSSMAYPQLYNTLVHFWEGIEQTLLPSKSAVVLYYSLAPYFILQHNYLTDLKVMELMQKKDWPLVANPPLRASILGDPRFTLAYSSPSSFQWWSDNNVTKLLDFYDRGRFISFYSLRNTKNIPTNEQQNFEKIKAFYETHYINPPGS